MLPGSCNLCSKLTISYIITKFRGKIASGNCFTIGYISWSPSKWFGKGNAPRFTYRFTLYHFNLWNVLVQWFVEVTSGTCTESLLEYNAYTFPSIIHTYILPNSTTTVILSSYFSYLCRITFRVQYLHNISKHHTCTQTSLTLTFSM